MLTSLLIIGASTARAVDTSGLVNLLEIYAMYQIDDQRGYCLDKKGHKSTAKIERGLQAHTCYSYQGEIAVDQDFDFDKLTKTAFSFLLLVFVWRQRQLNHQQLKNLMNAIITSFKISNGTTMAEYIWVVIQNCVSLLLRVKREMVVEAL